MRAKRPVRIPDDSGRTRKELPGIPGRLRTCGKTPSSADLWVTHSSERSAASSSTVSTTAPAAAASRWLVGSSRRRTGRFASRALATLRRRSSPPATGCPQAAITVSRPSSSCWRSAAGTCDRRLARSDARRRSGRRVACATACHSAGPCTARRAFASGPGSLAPCRRARDRCRRQTPARGLARFGRRPRGLPRSPPRRQRTTACRTFFIVSELQPMP